jgi:hypothetical protein
MKYNTPTIMTTSPAMPPTTPPMIAFMFEGFFAGVVGPVGEGAKLVELEAIALGKSDANPAVSKPANGAVRVAPP